MKKILLVALIVVGLSVGVTAYALGSLNSDPKVAFFKAELKNIQAMQEEWNDLFREDLNFIENMKGSAVRFTAEQTAIAEANDMPLDQEAQFERFNDFISKMKSSVTVDYDRLDRKMTGALDVLYDRETLLSGDMFVDDYKLGLHAKEAYDRYFMLDGNRFGEWMKSVDPSYDGVDKLDFFGSADFKEKSQSEQWNEVAKKYGKLLYDQIRTDQITVEKAEINGKSAKSYTLRLTNEDIRQIYETFRKTMKDDEALHKLLSALLPEVNWKAAFEEENSLVSTNDNLLFTLNLIVDGRGNMLKHEWTLGDTEGKLTYVHFKAAKEPYWQISFQPVGNSELEGGAFKLTDRYLAEKKDRKEHNIRFELPNAAAPVQLDANYVHSETGSTTKDDVRFTIGASEAGQPFKIGVGLQVERTFAKNSAASGTANLIFDVASPAHTEPFAFKITYSSNFNVGKIDQVKLPDAQNPVNVMELKEPESSQIAQEAQMNLQRHFEKFQEKIMQTLGSFL